MYTITQEKWGVGRDGQAGWQASNIVCSEEGIATVRRSLVAYRWFAKMCRFQFVRVSKGKWEERDKGTVRRRVTITNEPQDSADK